MDELGRAKTEVEVERRARRGKARENLIFWGLGGRGGREEREVGRGGSEVGGLERVLEKPTGGELESVEEKREKKSESRKRRREGDGTGS